MPSSVPLLHEVIRILRDDEVQLFDDLLMLGTTCLRLGLSQVLLERVHLLDKALLFRLESV